MIIIMKMKIITYTKSGEAGLGINQDQSISVYRYRTAKHSNNCRVYIDLLVWYTIVWNRPCLFFVLLIPAE